MITCVARRLQLYHTHTLQATSFCSAGNRFGRTLSVHHRDNTNNAHVKHKVQSVQYKHVCNAHISSQVERSYLWFRVFPHHSHLKCCMNPCKMEPSHEPKKVVSFFLLFPLNACFQDINFHGDQDTADVTNILFYVKLSAVLQWNAPLWLLSDVGETHHKPLIRDDSQLLIPNVKWWSQTDQLLLPIYLLQSWN
jgi:hypothetical protein